MFVLSHEIAHTELDHSAFGVAREIGLTVKDVLSTPEVDARDPRVRAAIRKVGRQIVNSPFLKANERDADVLGAQIAMDAGVSPAGIKTAMDRIAAIHAARSTPAGEPGRRLDGLTASHPDPTERLRALEAVLGPRFWEQ
jgi:predicted Zn-dependent protease